MNKTRQRTLMAVFVGLTVVFFAFAGSIRSSDVPLPAQVLQSLVSGW